MKIAFFETKLQEKDYLQNALSGNELLFYDYILNAGNLPPEAQDIEILSVHNASSVDAALIDKLPDLKFIAPRTTGYDKIDLHKAAEKNIPVSNIPGYGENTVAE